MSEYIPGAMHERTIMVGDVPVRFRSDASTPRVYRLMFGRDIFKDMGTLVDSFSKSDENGEDSEDGKGGGEGFNIPDTGLEALENIAYCMAKQAAPDIPEITEWLSQFGMFDIYSRMGDIITLWGINTRTQVASKKKRGRRRGK